MNPSRDSADERPSRAARRADALGALPETFLKHGGESLSGGERQQIVVPVDAETLRHSVAGRCEIEEGASLPAETVRRLGWNCSVVAMTAATRWGGERMVYGLALEVLLAKDRRGSRVPAGMRVMPLEHDERGGGSEER